MTRLSGWIKLVANPVFARLARGLPLALAAFFACSATAQYTPPYVGIIGTIGSANGMPASGYALTFTPTQVMYVGGTSVVVSSASCATDTNGAVVGLANPLTPAVVAVAPGTLPLGNYQVAITWYDTYSHQTLSSPAVNIQLVGAGGITVSPPVNGAPAQALGMDVYIGLLGNALTYQGQTTSPTDSFTQSTPLAAGAATPILNSTVCQVVANDAAWPIAGYMENLVDASGNTLPGFPKQVQFLSPGSTYNLSNGMPLWNGATIYPIPILTTPYNHNPQSISGPLSLTSYDLYNVGKLGVGTAVPGWGVDVEGTGTGGQVNAQGYLINGLGGALGQVPCSDGTAIDQFCNAAGYYQTVAAAGTAMTQRPTLNFSSNFALSDSASPAQTNVMLATVGVAGTYTNPTNITTNAFGQVVSITGNGSGRVCGLNGCYRIQSDGTIESWGSTTGAAGCSVWLLPGVCGEADSAEILTATFPYAYTNAANLRVVVTATGTPTGDGNPHTASCYVNGQASTTGFSAIISLPTQIGGSGYGSLVAGQTCSWIAFGY